MAILEMLSLKADGHSLAAVAEALDLPEMAARQVLTELVAAGFAKQAADSKQYRLTLKLANLGFTYLGSSGVMDLLQPIADALAASTGEFARIGAVKDDRLIWIAKSQGARSGLRYDCELSPGGEMTLYRSSNGQAWLSCLPEENALEILARHKFGDPRENAPGLRLTNEAFMACLREVRRQGYASAHEAYEVGASGIAAPIKHPADNRVIGVVSIAGPEARMHAGREHELVPVVLSAAKQLSALSIAIGAAAN